MKHGRHWFSKTGLWLGLGFLYLPILSMIVFSFNNSRLVTVWDGANSPTVKWYRLLLGNEQILGAAWLSIKIAAMTASGAVVLGTFAGLVLARFGAFRGRAFLSGMTTAPLVMPEVITGLSLLLLFVAIDAGRWFWTVTVAHTTLTMCFVTVVVQSRLGALDRSLEEAAMDLGCSPVKAFIAVTLPLMLPSIAAGWMLAFTLSLDDLVIASFTTGPGSARNFFQPSRVRSAGPSPTIEKEFSRSPGM